MDKDRIDGLPLLGESESSLELDDLDLSLSGDDIGAFDLLGDDDISSLGFLGDDDDDFSFGAIDLGAELLFTESDMSKIAFDYYNNLKAMQEKIQPPAKVSDDSFTVSSSDFPYLDTRYIAPIRLAILEQAKAQAGLKESARMSSQENAEEIFDALSNSFPFPIGANYNRFIETCSRKFEHFMKLVTVAPAQETNKFEHLLDKEKMEVSRFVFSLNGLLWNQITIYLSDDRIERSTKINFEAGGKMYYHCGVIGNAMEAYNEYLKEQGSRPLDVVNLTVGNLIDCVNYTLSFQNMANTLHFTQDEVINLSAGELLRRYVLLEYDEELFDLTGFRPMHKETNSITSTMFERVNVQFSGDAEERNGQIAAPYAFLRAPYYREGRGRVAGQTDSITHELLYYIFVILECGIADYRSEIRVSHDYLMMLSRYLIALMLKAPYVRPVTYYAPEHVADSENDFDLHFYVQNKYYSVREKGLLVSVIGDHRTAYLLPTVSVIDAESTNVKCSDGSDDNNSISPCVVLPLHRLFTDLQGTIKSVGASSKKLRIDGSTEYYYTPSLAWVASRSYSSHKDIEEAQEGEQVSTRTSSVLLNTLLSYTNKFEPERVEVVAGAATTNEGLSVLYLRDGGLTGAADAVRMICVLSGSIVLSQKGTMGFDEQDGALIMRYFQSNDGDEVGHTVVADSGSHEVNELSGVVHSSAKMPDISYYVDTSNADELYRYAMPELRSINRRLCELNALDYEEELESVRLVIMRDLKNVTVTYHMDTLLACKLVDEYSKILRPDSSVDPVNFNSLKALVRIILGEDSLLNTKSSWDAECYEVFEQVRRDGRVSLGDMCIFLDQLEPNVLALQALSASETSNTVDRERYMAMHAIPVIHCRLRNLEERMILLRVLREIEYDIATIFRKRTPMLTAYKDVTTASTLDDVEASLKSSMRGGKKFDAFPLTRKVLSADVGGSTPILKYFALERNVHGIMATAICSEDEQELELYRRFHDCLGLGAAGMPQIQQMDERTFLNAPFAISLESACSRNRGLLLKLIERGLLADASARIDIRILKAFDLLLSYGVDLFDIRPVAGENRYAENYEDVSEYMSAFYTYAGSFLVSYCYLSDEVVDSEASDPDRVVTFRTNMSGFVHSTDMSKLAEYELTDLRTVISE